MSEEDDIFVDASDSPDVGPRRSGRKRKSIAETEVEDQKTPKAGKRHRPLGKMGGVHRSPDADKNKTVQQKKQTTAGPSNTAGNNSGASRAELTVQTDPPSREPSAEQLVLLGGMRAVLREELQQSESRLTKRMSEIEDGFGHLREDVRSLERRLEEVERRAQDPTPRCMEDAEDSLDHGLRAISSKQARYWKARKSLRMWPIGGDGRN